MINEMNWRKSVIWLIFFVAIGSLLKAQQNIAPDTLVTLDYQNTSIKVILNDISHLYGIKFYYADTNVPVTEKITIQYVNQPLMASIQKILDQNHILFRIIGNQYVLIPRQHPEPLTIHGRIVEAGSADPVAFASVGISGTSRGTSSNEQGGFILTLDSLPAELVFSHINYERKIIQISPEDTVLGISLLPAVKTLRQVTVFGRKNENAYYNMVIKAYDKINNQKNHDQYGKAFYRQLSEKDDHYTEIFEIFFDVKYTSAGIQNWALQQGRYAFQNDEHEDIFVYNRNFTLLSRIIPVVQPQTDELLLPVNPDVKMLFDLRLKEIIDHHDHKIAVIEYKPKSTTNAPAASGEIYIDTKTYEIYKITGTFNDPALDIIKFNDRSSTWKNYLLSFDIVFNKTPQANKLQLDYIRISHSFDYYNNQQFNGHIQTSSLLSFYEYYNPPKEKKLGGDLPMQTADISAINEAGYNPTFWEENPIVKRTPLEENLVRDFEKNDAFAMVFLNSYNQIAFVPKLVNDATSKKITDILNTNTTPKQENIYLKTNQSTYVPGQDVHFTAFVLNCEDHKPSVLGSVLRLELGNQSNKLTTQSFEIRHGVATGTLNLAKTLPAGNYRLCATTNLPNSYVYTQSILLDGLHPNNFNDITINNVQQTPVGDLVFIPESGAILKNIPIRMGVYLKNQQHINSEITGYLIRNDQLISEFQLDKNGYATLGYTPATAENTSLIVNVNGTSYTTPFRPPLEDGLTFSVEQSSSQNLRIALYNNTHIHRKVYLAGTSHGKIYYLLDISLDQMAQTMEIPSINLPEGLFSLYLFDHEAQLLGMRKIFINHGNRLNVSVTHMKILNGRKGKLQAEINITDNEGFPVEGQFLCSVDAITQKINRSKNNICSYLLINSELEKVPFNQYFNIDQPTEAKAIDDYLITQSRIDHQKPYIIHFSEMKNEAPDSLILAKSNVNVVKGAANPMVAEVVVGSSPGIDQQDLSDRNSIISGKAEYQDAFNVNVDHNIDWIPKFETNSEGKATLQFSVPRTDKKMQFIIEGVSNKGQIACFRMNLNWDNLK